MVSLSSLQTGDRFLAPGVSPGVLIKGHGNSSTIVPSEGFFIVIIPGAARVIELHGDSQVTPYPHPIYVPVV